MLFICHSLGGIVFKQACNQAYDNARYQPLLKAIAGVAFFGTPHRGSSNIASLGNVLGRVLKAASFGANTNAQLLRDLERGSPVLDDIATTFMNRRYDFQICSFYETDKMDFMSSVVVDRHSAVLGIEGETVVAISGNHRSICRFTRSDTQLPVVLINLTRMLEHWNMLNRKVSEGVFFDRLGTSNHVLHKDRNPYPTQGTCSWVLSHPEFQRWHKATGPALMWLSANPGCGKSVMISFLIDHLRSSVESKNVHICYWFFKSDNQEQKSAIFALRGILRQLLEARRSVIQAVQEAAKVQSLDTLQGIWSLLIQAVRGGPSPEENDDGGHTAPVRHTVICLIDGLDECESGANRDLILLFQKYFQELDRPDPGTTNSKQKPGFMKLLIASRPENWIKVSIDRLKPVMPRNGQRRPDYDESASQCCAIRLKAEDESGFISADISLVVRAAIADLVDQGFPELLLHEIQKQLITRADRTFIWITLIIDLLRDKVEAGASRRELDDILKSRTVDQIFTEFLRGRPHAPKTRKVFSILLAATRPLNVEELSIALALTPEHSALTGSGEPFRPGPQSFEALEYDLVYPFENHIRSLGGHFIRIIRNEIYFVHETAREFLLENKGNSLYAFTTEEVMPAQDDWSVVPDLKRCSWQHSFSYQSCHALLLDLCATYLYLIGQATHQNHILSDDQAILLDYISKAWFVHFAIVVNHISQWNLPYYHNLCHPKFPGFSIWTEGYWTSRTEVNPTIGMTNDEIQDYYIIKLGLDPRHFRSGRSDDDYDNDYDEDIDEIEDIKTIPDDDEYKPTNVGIPISQRELLDFDSRNEPGAQNTERGALSANPTARNNHDFPLNVDKYGFVSLDFNIFSRHSH
ncbi:hypothetical protein EKO27_g8946 [Xylaria grammica]|uniref:Nephrocystin 3-like N-terminal domain-containing protein n=1 Tax=Xylaria grammica TaxID=363999 RepID=A0A439CVJ2_9PEZI|nr:hypothetical protein EKO27_g8946 [Xylaria grammica]